MIYNNVQLRPGIIIYARSKNSTLIIWRECLAEQNIRKHFPTSGDFPAMFLTSIQLNKFINLSRKASYRKKETYGSHIATNSLEYVDFCDDFFE